MRHLNTLIFAFFFFNSLSSQIDNFQIVVQKVDPSVLKIYVINDVTGEFESQGSGVILSNKGIGVTNYHVLVGAKKAIAITASGKQFDITKIVDFSKENDLVKFQMNVGSEVPTAVKIDSVIPLKGSSVFAVGYPNGFLLEGESTVTTGIISGTREKNGEKIIQTSTPITHGSSGGGLFNMQGNLIGITTGTFAEEIEDRHANMNMAVPVRLINALKDNKNLSLIDFYNSLKSTENLVLGMEAYNIRDFYSAVDFFSFHLEQYPEDAVTWFRLGNSMNQIGRIDLNKEILGNALQCFDIAISLDSNYFYPWGQAALIYSIIGDIPNAKGYATKAYQIEPYVSFTNYVIGKVANEAKDYTLAIDFLTYAIQLANDFDEVYLVHQWYLERAIAESLIDHNVSAENDFLKCIDLNPDNIDGYFQYAIFLYNLNKVSQACDYFNIVYNKNKNYSAGSYLISNVLNDFCK